MSVLGGRKWSNRFKIVDKKNLSQGFYIQPNVLSSKKDAYKLVSNMQTLGIIVFPMSPS